MLNALWQFFFPKKHPEPPPLPRPKKYPRTQNLPSQGQFTEAYANEGLSGPASSFPQPISHGLPPGSQSQHAFPLSYPQTSMNLPPGLYGPGFNPWMGNFSVPYQFPGYQLSSAPHQNQWPPAFGIQYQPVPPRFAPPAYPPSGPGGSTPFIATPAPVSLPTQPNIPAPSIIQVVKNESLRPTTDQPSTLVHDHAGASDLDWPMGYVRRICTAGDEPRKWKHNKWVWRSNGTVQHEGCAAELRLCLGVLRCDTCQRLSRPRTQIAARKQQIKNGCQQRTCSIDSPLVHDVCDARTFHYKLHRNGQTMLVWEHHGDHSTHARPPGGGLSKTQEDEVDLQVMRRHEATAHELRTGDPGPGSVPFPDISPSLASPSKARYQLAQSQTRLGLNTGSSKGGLAFMSAFADLNKRLSTPFIVDSSLSGPIYMTFKTAFMDDILREAVESWILDLEEGPEASRHGIVIDGDHTFFRHGLLLASCAFNVVSGEWIPILYSWINGLDKTHHRPHFAHIFQSVIKHAGKRFTRKLLLCVMDFSGAQRGAHAEEYAEAIISTMPHFSQLSQEAQEAERQQLIIEAQKGELGCHVHFWRSADQVKKTHSLIPPESANVFESSLRELISPYTTLARYDEIILMLKTTFPAIKHWLSWWERGPIASMIFPAKSSVDPELAAKAPSNTNPIEHQHSLLHHAVGKDQELVPGIEKLFLHMREMEHKYNAIKGMSLVINGHFNAGQVRNRRPAKLPVYQPNDGRPPDTVAALAVAAAAEASGTNFPPALSSSPAVLPLPDSAVKYSPRMLQSFKWDSPNSCFFDSPLEIWFRAFSRWSDSEKQGFLASLPSNSALAKFFYIFARRILWIGNGSEVDIHGIRDLSLCQSHARSMIFGRWKLYKHASAYGNATSWLHHATRDSGTSVEIQLHFRLAHLVSGTCPSGHEAIVGLPGTPDVLTINLFDLRIAQAKPNATTTLTEYFANFIPRILGGNEVGGTLLVHNLPPPVCTHCPNHFQPEFIQTHWPKILQINPDTGTQPRVPITRTFTVSDGSGASIAYELVGTVSFNAQQKHYTSKILIDNTTFQYDGLIQRGALVPMGPAELICTLDPRAVMWTYHRVSEDDRTICATNDVVLAYQKALEIYTRIPPPSPGSTLQNTPPASPVPPPRTTPAAGSVQQEECQNKGDTEMPAVEDSRSSSVDRLILAALDSDPSSGKQESTSTTPCPIFCVCGVLSDGDDDTNEVQCENCGFWSHMRCVGEDEEHWENTEVTFLCHRCSRRSPGDNFRASEIVMLAVRSQQTEVYFPARFVGHRQHGRTIGREFEFEFSHLNAWIDNFTGSLADISDPYHPSRVRRSEAQCGKIFNLQLGAGQIGKIRRPIYEDPNIIPSPDHPLIAIFNAATPQVAAILAQYPSNSKDHPAAFALFQYQEQFDDSSKFLQFIRCHPTRELRELMQGPLHEVHSRLCDDYPSASEDDINARVAMLGHTLFMLLAIQHELGDPLDLNGDTLSDILDGKIIRASYDEETELFHAMYQSTNPLELTHNSRWNADTYRRNFSTFFKAHRIYDPNYRPPLYKRSSPFQRHLPSIPIHTVPDLPSRNPKRPRRASHSSSDSEVSDPSLAPTLAGSRKRRKHATVQPAPNETQAAGTVEAAPRRPTTRSTAISKKPVKNLRVIATGKTGKGRWETVESE